MQTSAELLARYLRVRDRSLSLCAPLSAEDAQVQTMTEASPAKWHLAHTTWFFEQFVIAPLGEPVVHPAYGFLFNSYYEGVGARVERARRGLATRPSLDEVEDYRRQVDMRVAHALVESRLDETGLSTVALGIAHEEQHQELILTDLKHVFGTQPLRPAYREDLSDVARATVAPADFVDFEGGVVEIGARDGFAYDCELPRHRVVVEPFRLATRPVCNAEVIAFIADRGYQDARLWLSDGWQLVKQEQWEAPLYWEQRASGWWQYTLAGMREVDPAETACHLSYFEADAIARWAGARLPTESEWELAANNVTVEGNFVEDDRLHPTAASGDGLRQLFGDVWEWTASAFAPYPGYRPLPGALGEYNGKFMASQQVMRGGSCLTPRDHIRASYRNFFPPSTRWQMTGVRLAADGGSS
jgi:ergothioneine biosynthesis protein EgtB